MVPALEGLRVQGRRGKTDPGRDFLQCRTVKASQTPEGSCKNRTGSNSLPLVREGLTEEVIFDLGHKGEPGFKRVWKGVLGRQNHEWKSTCLYPETGEGYNVAG